ncbi:hypothetical protein H0H92_006490, partial [Tricholoma furcatifolium]
MGAIDTLPSNCPVTGMDTSTPPTSVSSRLSLVSSKLDRDQKESSGDAESDGESVYRGRRYFGFGGVGPGSGSVEALAASRSSSSSSMDVVEDSRGRAGRAGSVTFSRSLHTTRRGRYGDDLGEIESSQDPVAALEQEPSPRPRLCAHANDKERDDAGLYSHAVAPAPAPVASKELLEWAALEEEYGDPGNVLYRRWARAQRVVEWRRYRVAPRIESKSKQRSGEREAHEYLVVKLAGAAEVRFLRFERMEKQGGGRTGGKGEWVPDDRVTTTLREWPWCDEICEAYVFERRGCGPDLLDLFLVAHLVHWTQPYKYRERPSHWFAVLFARCIGWRDHLERREERKEDAKVVKKGFFNVIKASSDERDAEADVGYWCARLKQTRQGW